MPLVVLTRPAPAPPAPPKQPKTQVPLRVAEEVAAIITRELVYERDAQNRPGMDPRDLCDAQKVRLAGNVADRLAKALGR